MRFDHINPAPAPIKRTGRVESILWTFAPPPDAPYRSPGGKVCCGGKRQGRAEWGEDPSAFYHCESTDLLPYRCSKHGGSNDQFASRYFPRDLKQTAERLFRDPYILSLRAEIALLKARADEIKQLIDDLPSRAIVDEFGALVQDKYGDTRRELWKEHDQINRELKDLCRIEAQRESELQSSLNTREAYLIVTAMQNAVDEVVAELYKSMTHVAETIKRHAPDIPLGDIGGEARIRSLVYTRFTRILGAASGAGNRLARGGF